MTLEPQAAPDLSADPPAPPQEGSVWPCVHCGYDLRGLETTGECPECGSPVADSAPDELLVFAPDAYLESLRRGVVLVAAGLIGGMVAGAISGGVGAYFTSVNPNRPMPTSVLVLQLGLGLLVALVTLAGWWLFTIEDHRPARPVEQAPMRFATRALAIGQFPLALGTSALSIGSAQGMIGPLAFGVMLVAFAYSAVFWIFAMLYASALALRVQDPRLARRTRTYAWLLPLLSTVGILLCGLGPLVAMVLALVAMFALRARVGEILASRPPAHSSFA